MQLFFSLLRHRFRRESSGWIALLLALAICGFPTSPLAAQPASLEEFESYVANAVEEWGIPGLAISIVKDDEVVLQEGFGVCRVAGRERVNAATRFAIGSTTKAFTAASIGMLVDEKKLNWDDLVIEHLPWFQLADPHVTRELTVRDLLTHRAGLGNADLLWYGRDFSTQEILQRLRFLPPETSMRSHFTYQNIMYAAAGELIAATSGASWEAFVRTRILEPLHMDGTATSLRALRGENIATPHDRVEGQVVPIENASVDAVASAGAIWSSAEDMAKWLRYLLEDSGPELLQPQTKAELFRPQMIVGRDAFYPTAQLTRPHWTTYGLGWFQEDYQGRAVDFHTGSIDGMVALAGLIRDEHLGVYILANLDHAELRHALMYTVFDLFGPSPPERDWSAEMKQLFARLSERAAEQRQRRAESRVPDTQPSHELQAFTGRYENPIYGQVEVSLQEGKLHLYIGPGLQGPMEHWHYDTFEAHWEARWRGTALVTFVTASNGQIGELRWAGNRFLKRVE